MDRRKFLAGLAAATVVGPVAVQSAEYFPWQTRFPTPEMVEAMIPLTTPGVTVTEALIEQWSKDIVAAFRMRTEHLR